ncbi:hypothetical protein V9T40_000119 [Parthenolecanium corni]|uniref:Glycoside hydrolase family 32 protein n=1 Tax=Parthenolecanium corni TaxID=536013 RepID=A0AAN9TI64_9HEMI
MNINSPFLYSPKKGWVNDPNGLVYVDGIYHLFYQYSPTSNGPNNICWGHAISNDLVRWQDKGVAIDYREDLTEEIFSGSAVIDNTNSSGLCDLSIPVVAYYMSHYQKAATLPDGSKVAADTQAQTMAYSCDGGNIWQTSGVPSICRPPMKYASEYNNFRDPNMFWYQPHKKWIMTLVMPTVPRAIWYASENLLNWTFTGEFSSPNAPKGLWECPALMEFPVQNAKETKWVLVMSTNPGGLSRASGMYYYVGLFNGSTFKVDENQQDIKWFDYGADCYAGIFWSNLPGKQKCMSMWIDNWEYGPKIGNKYKDGIAHREVRLLKVDNTYKLFQAPIQQLDKYVQKVNNLTKLLLKIGIKIFKNEAHRIIMVIKGANESDFSFVIEDEKKRLLVKIYFIQKDNTVCVQRQKPDSGEKEQFENHCAELILTTELKMEMLIDNFTMTLYLKDGECVFTEILPFCNEKRKFRLLFGFHKIKILQAKQMILANP